MPVVSQNVPNVATSADSSAAQTATDVSAVRFRGRGVEVLMAISTISDGRASAYPICAGPPRRNVICSFLAADDFLIRRLGKFQRAGRVFQLRLVVLSPGGSGLQPPLQVCEDRSFLGQLVPGGGDGVAISLRVMRPGLFARPIGLPHLVLGCRQRLHEL